METQLLEKIERSFRDVLSHGIVPKDGATIVVAVSGGRDSMVLLELLARLRRRYSFQLIVAHVDHGLREESKRDAGFVEMHAKRLSLRFFSTHLTPPTPLRNIEHWARGERYRYLESIRKTHGADLICTAHHLDDQAETFMLRLGSGRLVSSSACIEEYSVKRSLWRPMLAIAQSDIARYALDQEVPYVEDLSNQSPLFLRNRVRNELLPLMRELFSDGVSQALVTTLSRLQSDEVVANRVADKLPNATWRSLQERARMQINEDAHLIGYADYQRVLTCLSRGEPTRKTVELGSNLYCEVFSPTAYRFCRGEERVDSLQAVEERSFRITSDGIQSVEQEGSTCVSLEANVEAERNSIVLPWQGQGELTIRIVQEYRQLETPLTAGLRFYLAIGSENMSERLLRIRLRRSGDSISLSTAETRTLKRILQDAKVAHELRWTLPLIEVDERILWIPGVYAERKSPSASEHYLEFCYVTNCDIAQ